MQILAQKLAHRHLHVGICNRYFWTSENLLLSVEMQIIMSYDTKTDPKNKPNIDVNKQNNINNNKYYYYYFVYYY